MELKDIALQVSNDIHKEGRLILLIKFGSHLYGTNTENSDTDYKGIYVPSYKNMIMGTAQDTIHRNTCKGHGQKNTKDDVDLEITSIKKFVALAFIGDVPDGSEVMHLDGNNYNNRSDNLRYGSRICNSAFKVEHGTNNFGSKNPMSKLSVEEVATIKRLLSNKVMVKDIAAEYGVSPHTISRIKNGRTYND